MSRANVRLGEVASIDVGFPFRSADFTSEPGHVRLLRGDNIAQGRLRWDDAKRLPPRVEVDERYRLRVGDSVVAMDRPWIGAGLKRAAVRAEDLPALLVQRVARLRATSPDLHQRFLNAVIDSAAFSDYLVSVQTGTAVPHISASQIGAFRFPLPTLSEQQAIADVLGVLDDKRAANANRAEAAFVLAQSTFGSASRRLTPTERVGDVATVVLGGTPARSNATYWANGTVPWLQSGAANADRIVEPSTLITAEALQKSAAKLMPVGATVIAITGATLGQVSRLEIEASGNQSLVGAWSNSAADSAWLHFALRDAVPELLKHATGAAQQHVSKGTVAGLAVKWPDDALRQCAGSRIESLLTYAASADVESKALRRTRDALLPELVSGRLRVKDAERAVEEAV